MPDRRPTVEGRAFAARPGPSSTAARKPDPVVVGHLDGEDLAAEPASPRGSRCQRRRAGRACAASERSASRSSRLELLVDRLDAVEALRPELEHEAFEARSMSRSYTSGWARKTLPPARWSRPMAAPISQAPVGRRAAVLVVVAVVARGADRALDAVGVDRPMGAHRGQRGRELGMLGIEAVGHEMDDASLVLGRQLDARAARRRRARRGRRGTPASPRPCRGRRAPRSAHRPAPAARQAQRASAPHREWSVCVCRLTRMPSAMVPSVRLGCATGGG